MVCTLPMRHSKRWSDPIDAGVINQDVRNVTLFPDWKVYIWIDGCDKEKPCC